MKQEKVYLVDVDDVFLAGLSRSQRSRIKSRGYIIFGYHRQQINVNYDNIDFEIKDIRKIVGSELHKYISYGHYYFDDIVSEVVYNFLRKSGKIKKNAIGFLRSITKSTCMNFCKKSWAVKEYPMTGVGIDERNIQ